MLKTAKVQLELLSDVDVLLFCEKAIGGILMELVKKCFMRAKNSCLPDNDEIKPSTYGLFLDVVNL